MRRTHLSDFVGYNARHYPQKPAVITATGQLSWRELADRVMATANAIAPYIPSSTPDQQVVGMLMSNSWECVVTYLAILTTGHIAAPLDPNYKALELEAILDQLPMCVVIAEAAQIEKLEGLETPTVAFGDLVARPGYTWTPLRLPAAEQIASLMFTSGTTGKPKIAPYTHANHIWNIATTTKIWRWTEADTLLISLPLSHWHGIVIGIAGMLYHGNTMYLQERFYARDTLELLASGKITLFPHVAQAYVNLAEYDGGQRYDLSGVRVCSSASGALPPVAWHKLKAKYKLEVLECYGSAEAGRIASNTLRERLAGTPGRIIDGVQVKLGSDGEILVKTPGLFPGYYHNAEATVRNMVDGWWVMGDIGAFDDDTRIHIKGRIQEKIKKQGYTIYPRDVEWALLKNTAVSEVLVVGMRDEATLGDKLVYCVASTLSENQISAWCTYHLPFFWQPDYILPLNQVPRTRTGKPRLTELRSMAQSHIGLG